MGKGFLVAHQKVSVNISLNGKIHGFTDLTLTPTSNDLKTIWLNARNLHVISASLRVPKEVPLQFTHFPPAIPRLDSTDIHTYPALKRQVWGCVNEGEEGELGIGLPPNSITKFIPEITVGETEKKEKVKDEWEQITISVEYEVREPGAGIVIAGPDQANPSRFPHVFTSPSDISARTWLPCSDALWDRCTWDLELIVPKILYSTSPSSTLNQYGEEEAEEIAEWPLSVICSGELIEQVVHPTRSDRIIWHYMQATPVSAQQIAWAVGPFVLTEIGSANGVEEDEIEEDDGAVKLFGLCLPGREEEIKNCVGVLRKALDFYTTNFGSYPFTTYTIGFIDSLASGSPTFHSAAMTLFSSDLLHPSSIIDQTYETRHLLAHALAMQWSGVNLIPRLPSDTWLTSGIALHITSLFIKDLWGNNEYRFRLKKDIIRCVAQDVQREPICVQARATPHEPDQLAFIALKAPLVLYILDKHLRKSGTSLGLDKVLPKLFLDAITGDLGSGITLNTVSTSSFLRTCRKSCGGSLEALKTFFDQWIYGSGCPTFIIEAVFNRKKMAIELNIQQDCLAFNWTKSTAWEENSHTRPMDLFEGQMTIRIHEADGTPYEHTLSISEKFKRHEVPFNTKYKRIRRNTKRYQARQAAASAAALGDMEAQEDMGLIDVGFSLNLWEDEKERERWRVADWGEEDDVIMSQATYEWIRIDPDLEWIAGISFTQPDFMWLSQLQRDRDVIAQLDAIHALSRMPSPIVSSNLAKTVLVTNYFFRVRMEAALALISCATKDQQFLGLFHLFKLFQTRYCFEPDVETNDPLSFRCIPKPNDFTDLTEYFLKKTLLIAISMVRDETGQTPVVVLQFLIDSISYNDNLANTNSDTFYITTMISSLAHALVAVAPGELSEFSSEVKSIETELPLVVGESLEQVNRYMNADRLVPSYRNAITVAGIEFKLKLTMANLIPTDLAPLYNYTREGNYPAVRIAAFDALLLLGTLDASNQTILDHRPLIRYYFSVLKDDSSMLIKRRLAQSMLECLPILVAIGDFGASTKKGLVFEEAKKKEKDVAVDMDDLVLKPLRNAVGRQNRYREGLLAALRANLDPEVLYALLKICENTIKPKGEPVPKLVIRVPVAPEPSASSTPVDPALTGVIPKLRFTQSATPKISIPARSGSEAIILDAEARPLPLKIKIRDPARAVHRSEASGMTMQDVKSCQSILMKLNRSKISLLFRNPVDPVKSGAPGYFDVITHPMDLTTMSFKVADGLYTSKEAFRQDLKLIISNAVLYNISGIVVDQARELDAIFEKQWSRVMRTLGEMGSQAYYPPPAVDYPPTPLPASAAVIPVEYRQPPPLVHFAEPMHHHEPQPVYQEPSRSATPVSAIPATSGFKLKFSMPKPQVAPPPPPSAQPPPSADPLNQPPPMLPPSIQEQVVAPAPQTPIAPAPISSGFKLKFKMPAPVPPPSPILTGVFQTAESATAPTVPRVLSPKPVAPAETIVAPTPSYINLVPPPPPPPSYINLVPPPPLAAPLSTPQVISKPSGLKLKFNTSASSSASTSAATPIPQKKEKSYKPPKIKTFDEDIDEMFPAKPIKIKSHSMSASSSSSTAPEKKKVVSYVESPSPPPNFERFEKKKSIVILKGGDAPDPSHYFGRNDPINSKKVKAVLKKTVDCPESFFFRDPVEAVGGLVMYYQEITHPMDLKTLSTKINSGEFRTYGPLFDSFQLIVDNCKQFNPPLTEPVLHVEILEKVWRSEWEKASRMAPKERIQIGAVLKGLMKEGAAFPFLYPLDPVLAGVPHYYETIPKANCRDLTTIQKNLIAERYISVEEVEADVNLMVDNCLEFNPVDSPVHVSGLETRALFDQAMERVRGTVETKGVKRSKDSGGGISKKQKH